MIGRPQATEAAPYYSGYIKLATGEDPVAFIEAQLEPALKLLKGVSEERSLHRYAPGKWSMRELVNHIADLERAFGFRALWFARGFDAPLPGYDQEIATPAAHADRIPWAEHIEEFRRVRLATISLFRNLPAEAWSRGGIASDNHVTVRALAFIIAGHVEHHVRVVRERYLG